MATVVLSARIDLRALVGIANFYQSKGVAVGAKGTVVSAAVRDLYSLLVAQGAIQPVTMDEAVTTARSIFQVEAKGKEVVKALQHESLNLDSLPSITPSSYLGGIEVVMPPDETPSAEDVIRRLQEQAD